MNIQHACRCYAPAPQPSPEQVPAEQAGTQPAPLPTAAKQTTTLVASLSYSYSAYFSQAYVSAASQSAAQSGGAEQTGGQTAAEPQPEPAKVLTGTVRAALRPETAGSADADASTPALAGTAGASAPAAGESGALTGSVDKPAIERAEPAEFRRFRLKQFQASTETSLKLELETREGDRIVLDFSQVEALSRTRFRGRDDAGGQVSFKATAESLERLVSIEITGDISEAERAAIDAVFDRVLEVANSFFGGSTKDALARVRDMEIDADTLLDFSLSMSQKRSIEATRAYRNTDAGIERLASRDVEVSRTLDYLGESQRALVAEAREVLDDRSAAKMVRSLLPAMLERSMLDQSKLELAESAAAGGEPADAAEPTVDEQPATA